MGYMGFGLQSWIYSMQPRKPFSCKRKVAFTSVPRYTRDFKLQHTEPSNNIGAYICIALVVIFSIGIFEAKPRMANHSNHLEELRIERKTNAFKFLLESGKMYLIQNDYEAAYSEFNLAYQINPKHKEIRALIVKSLSALCYQKDSYCDELDRMVQMN